MPKCQQWLWPDIGAMIGFLNFLNICLYFPNFLQKTLLVLYHKKERINVPEHSTLLTLEVICIDGDSQIGRKSWKNDRYLKQDTYPPTVGEKQPPCQAWWILSPYTSSAQISCEGIMWPHGACSISPRPVPLFLRT